MRELWKDFIIDSVKPKIKIVKPISENHVGVFTLRHSREKKTMKLWLSLFGDLDGQKY